MNSGEYGFEEGQNNLYIGDLEPFMDEQYLYSLFGGIGGGLASVKLIRNRSTSTSEGYAFMEFNSHEDAATVLKNFRERPLPGAPGKVFKLNWGKFGNGTATQGR
jgi:RNA recognition motif-containing protein